MTIAMRLPTAILVLCALAIPAAAQAPQAQLVAPLSQAGPPSKTLERAIKLYDKQDFFSASIELGKVVQGESGDTVPNVQRAEFFMAKTHYQMGFYVVAWARLAAIAERGDAHPYFHAAAKWFVAILHVTPSPSVRSGLFAYRDGKVLDDPALDSVRDEFAYALGRELASRDVPSQEAIAMLAKVSESSSPYAPRALLEIARLKFRDKDISGGSTRAVKAAGSPELATEAARLIASWTHIHGAADQARAPLSELAKSSAYARYQLSRALLDGKRELPGLDRVTAEAFDAVMLPSACRGQWPDDIKPLARKVIDEAKPLVAKLLALDDNAELYERVRRLQKSPPAPGNDVVLAVLSDPAMQERFAWIAELEKELDAVQRADKAWQTTMVAAEALQELTLVLAIEQAEIGVHARQRLGLLARDLAALERVLADASAAFALSAGPDVQLGSGLVVAPELCRTGGISPVIVATPSTPPTTKPTSGCAGCTTHEPGWSLFAFAALVLVLATRRATAR